MSPRRRTIDDQAVLAGTRRAIGRLGPHRVTLADVGREVGLSAATVLQRFGAKRGLLLALAADGANTINGQIAAIRAEQTSPLEALMATAVAITRLANSPEALSNHLACLQMDLTDPEFHALALAQSRAVRKAVRGLLGEAVERGELISCNTRALGRMVQIVVNGSLITWSVHRKGSAAAAMRRDVGQLLAPWRRGTPPVAER